MLSALRAERGWTLRELAERSGLSVAYVSELEHARKVPTLEVLEQLAKAYDLSLAAFLRMLAEHLEPEPSGGDERCTDASDLDEEERAEIERFIAYLRWRRGHGGESVERSRGGGR